MLGAAGVRPLLLTVRGVVTGYEKMLAAVTPGRRRGRRSGAGFHDLANIVQGTVQAVKAYQLVA